MSRNDLMWRAHLDAEPPNAPLFYGPYATDPALYTDRNLEGFDAWMGVGRILTAPQLFEGGLTRDVYFPKASPDDQSLYFDLHPPYGTHTAGQRATVATPIEHGAMFAREGSRRPLRQRKGYCHRSVGPCEDAHRRCGCRTRGRGRAGECGRLERVVPIPGRAGRTYNDEWIEDDGISTKPDTSRFKVSYSGTDDSVKIDITVEDGGFKPMWGGRVHVVLPVGDNRKVLASEQTTRWKDRVAWIIDLQDDIIREGGSEFPSR